jgi:hypothetical protein
MFTALSLLSATKIQQTVPEWFASFTSNLAAGFLGAFVTAFFIDRIIQRERREEKDKAQKVALALLRPPLLRHLGLLADWYKAAAQQKPVKLPQSISEIFTPEYYETVRNMDFSKKGPCTPPTTWINFSVDRLDDLRTEISGVIDKYAIFIEAEFLHRLEKLRGSTLISILVWLRHDARVGNVLRGIINASNQKSSLVEEHVNCFLDVLNWYNTHATDPVTIETIGLWHDHTAPSWGSARSTQYA